MIINEFQYMNSNVRPKLSIKLSDIAKKEPIKEEVLTEEEAEQLAFMEEYEVTEEDIIQSKVLRLSDKIQSGKELSNEELDFLAENSPGLYKLAREVNKEREEYRKEVEQCSTKEEVKKVKLRKNVTYLSRMETANRAGNNEEALKQVTFIRHINDEELQFKKNDDYKKLPTRDANDDFTFI